MAAAKVGTLTCARMYAWIRSRSLCLRLGQAGIPSPLRILHWPLCTAHCAASSSANKPHFPDRARTGCCRGGEQMHWLFPRMRLPMSCITQQHLVSDVMSGTVNPWSPVERDRIVAVVQELMKEFLEREKRKQAEREAEKAAKSEAPAAEPEKEKASA